MSNCPITARLLLAIAIGFAFGALSSGLGHKIDPSEALEQVTFARHVECAEPSLRRMARHDDARPAAPSCWRRLPRRANG